MVPRLIFDMSSCWFKKERVCDIYICINISIYPLNEGILYLEWSEYPHSSSVCESPTLPSTVYSSFQAASMSCLLLQHEKQSSWEFAVLIDCDSKKMQTVSFKHLLFILHNAVCNDCQPSGCCCYDCQLMDWLCTISLYILGISGTPWFLLSISFV